MSALKRPARLSCALCGAVICSALIGQGEGALSGSTERIRDTIGKYDFPGSEPVMDPQQQFIVFSPDQRLSREMLELVLNLRLRIYRFFNISKLSDQPAFVLIFPTKERYALQGTGGATIQFKYRNQYVRLLASYMQEHLTDRILPHEMVHFLIADLSTVGGGAQGRPPELPVFINEGIAEYFSASAGRRLLFEKSVWESYEAGKLEPFKKIVTSAAHWAEALTGGESSWAQRAQGYSVVSFLASLPNGNVKLRNYILSFGTSAGRFSRDEASLRAFEMAFRQDYSSWEGLQSRWVQHIQDREIVVLEGESASVVDSSGDKWEVKKVRREKLWLSGEKELVLHASKLGSFVELQSDFGRPGAFDVYGIYTQGPDFGQFKLSLQGQEFPGVFEGYDRQEKVCEPVYHGKALIGPGTVTARLSVVGKARISAGYDVGVDCFVLRRDRRLEGENQAVAREYLRAGADHYQGKRFREAEANFTKVLDLVPGDASALEWRAYARIALGHLDQAEQDVDTAIKLSPQNARLNELKKRIEAARSGSN
jgi:tetratricopeptide (TPR) repeat protein